MDNMLSVCSSYYLTKKKRLTKTCLDISSTFTEKETWICNSTPFTWTWNQVFMLLLKLFFKILRSKLAASILRRPGTGRSRKLASQLITKTKILRLAAGSKCFSQCQPFRQMKLKTALLSSHNPSTHRRSSRKIC